MSDMADVAAMARVLYVAAHWQDTISEHDRDRKPQAEYERRAAAKWDKGDAGWSHYQTYPSLAAALSAAGFGPVQESQREAWDEGAEEAAEHYAAHAYDPNSNGPVDPPRNPYRQDT